MGTFKIGKESDKGKGIEVTPAGSQTVETIHSLDVYKIKQLQGLKYEKAATYHYCLKVIKNDVNALLPRKIQKKIHL